MLVYARRSHLPRSTKHEPRRAPNSEQYCERQPGNYQKNGPRLLLNAGFRYVQT
jgi:hypothetical protein